MRFLWQVSLKSFSDEQCSRLFEFFRHPIKAQSQRVKTRSFHGERWFETCTTTTHEFCINNDAHMHVFVWMASSQKEQRIKQNSHLNTLRISLDIQTNHSLIQTKKKSAKGRKTVRLIIVMMNKTPHRLGWFMKSSDRCGASSVYPYGPVSPPGKFRSPTSIAPWMIGQWARCRLQEERERELMAERANRSVSEINRNTGSIY